MGKEITVYVVQHYDWDSSYVCIFSSVSESIEWLVNNECAIYVSDFEDLTFGEIIEIFNDCNYGLEEYKISINED